MKEPRVIAAQANLFAPFRVTLLILTLLASLSCGFDSRSSDSDDEYWLSQLHRAEDELRRENLTQEERGKAMVRMARAQFGLGRQSNAVAIWEELRDDPQSDLGARTRAVYRLALWHEQQELWNEAVLHYREYASLYTLLAPEQQSNFDENIENPASLLFHVGEIQEHTLQKFDDAEGSYLNAITYARETENLNLDDLRRLYGDFLFRRGRIEDALGQYEVVTSADAPGDWPPSTVSTIARVKMIECLCLLGRCTDARSAFEPMAERWVGTEYESRTGYVKQGKELLDQHCGS